MMRILLVVSIIQASQIGLVATLTLKSGLDLGKNAVVESPKLSKSDATLQASMQNFTLTYKNAVDLTFHGIRQINSSLEDPLAQHLKPVSVFEMANTSYNDSGAIGAAAHFEARNILAHESNATDSSADSSEQNNNAIEVPDTLQQLRALREKKEKQRLVLLAQSSKVHQTSAMRAMSKKARGLLFGDSHSASSDVLLFSGGTYNTADYQTTQLAGAAKLHETTAWATSASIYSAPLILGFMVFMFYAGARFK